MDARQLLQSIEARGGVATVKTDESGAAKINVAPRSLALELLPDLQRFKPALLELLGTDTSEPAQNHAQNAPAPNDATGDGTGPQTPVFAGFSPSPDFALWHWRMCVSIDRLTAAAPYESWEQFARFQTGKPTRGDVLFMAWQICAAFGVRASDDKRERLARLRVWWRVANELTGVSMESPELASWARAISAEETRFSREMA